jgi:hypothetical protein
MSDSYSVLIEEAQTLINGAEQRIERHLWQISLLERDGWDSSGERLILSGMERGLRHLQLYRAVLNSNQVAQLVLPEYARARFLGA